MAAVVLYLRINENEHVFRRTWALCIPETAQIESCDLQISCEKYGKYSKNLYSKILISKRKKILWGK